jgi:hypothetical protein
VRRVAIGLLVLVAGSGAAAAPAASPDLRIANEIVLTRADGTAIPVKQTFRVWCGPWERDVPKPSVHVQAGARGELWTMSAVVADVRRRPVVRFPHSFIFDKPTGARLFAGDGRNEASTSTQKSSGRITFSRVRCGKRPDVRFEVAAVIGSELFDGTPVAMRGSFSARG